MLYMPARRIARLHGPCGRDEVEKIVRFVGAGRTEYLMRHREVEDETWRARAMAGAERAVRVTTLYQRCRRAARQEVSPATFKALQ